MAGQTDLQPTDVAASKRHPRALQVSAVNSKLETAVAEHLGILGHGLHVAVLGSAWRRCVRALHGLLFVCTRMAFCVSNIPRIQKVRTRPKKRGAWNHPGAWPPPVGRTQLHTFFTCWVSELGKAGACACEGGCGCTSSRALPGMSLRDCVSCCCSAAHKALVALDEDMAARPAKSPKRSAMQEFCKPGVLCTIAV